MRRFVLPFLLGALAWTQLALANADPDHGPGKAMAAATAANPAVPAAADPGSGSGTPATGAPNFLPPLPQVPLGRTTVIGGIIRSIDPVLDELTLDVYGGKSTKIYYDERTKFYRDGVQTPLDDMHARDHASVETLLDGDDVFAVSVHMLSRAPQGDCEGQVLAFDPRDGRMTVRNMLSGEPIELWVQPRTTIARAGQKSFTAAERGTTDLMRGALISVDFESDNRGNAIANAISILATPGSGFYFSGDVTYLDLHAGLLSITDPRDEKSYSIRFTPAMFPDSGKLHVGSRVGVTARFNGRDYMASEMNVY